MAYSNSSSSIPLISFSTASIILWAFLTLHPVEHTKPWYKISSAYSPLSKKTTSFKRKVLSFSYCLLCSSLRNQLVGLNSPAWTCDEKIFSSFSDSLFEKCIVLLFSTIIFVIFCDFFMFCQIFLYRKWNDTRLLLMNVVHINCRTCCRTT